MRTLRSADICIVGLGAAGALAAHVLTAGSKTVVGLEAGPPRSGRDFAMDELESSMVRNRWGTAKFNAEVPTWRRTPTSPREPTPAYQFLANGVGGSSLAYGGVSFRYHPDDFRARSSTLARYGAGALPDGSSVVDWPVGYEDLEPFYERAEQMLGVAGQAGNLRGEIQPGGNPFEGPRQRPYPLPPLRTSGVGALFAEAAGGAGYHPFPVPAAILSQPYQGRHACTYCSFCTRLACHVGAKGSVLETVIPEALATGKLEIRTGCRVFEIALDERAEVIGVVYVDSSGERVLQPAERVLLATYTFENVRLLQLSRSRHHPNGIGNGHDLLGRYYMARQVPSVFGVFEGRRLNRFAGPFAQGQTIDDLNADHFDHTGLGFIRGGRIAAVNQFSPIVGSGQVPPEVPRWGGRYKQFLASAYNSHAMLVVDTETMPYFDNRLDLDPDVRDAAGVPVTRITFDIHENERRALAFLQDQAVNLLKRMGATRIWSSPIGVSAISTHDVGGTRMGDHPATSIVNRFGEVHEAPRLYVLGGSTFPTQGGLNPTLTLQALALRTAAHILQPVLDTSHTARAQALA